MVQKASRRCNSVDKKPRSKILGVRIGLPLDFFDDPVFALEDLNELLLQRRHVHRRLPKSINALDWNVKQAPIEFKTSEKKIRFVSRLDGYEVIWVIYTVLVFSDSLMIYN